MRSFSHMPTWKGYTLAPILVLVIAADAAAREDAILSTAYGHGVHAYYAGDFQQSYDQLTAAIEGGTKDPRAFYFRGLAAWKLGRLDEAEADFTSGAAHEAGSQGNWPVARSLERIQGEPRLQLERHRVRARMVAMEQRRQAIMRRYSEVEAAQTDVQRTRRPENVRGAPAERPRQPTESAEPSERDAAEATEELPAGDDAAEAEMPEDEGGTKPAADDPFGS
ncbi:MAG: hypothetical protein ACKOYJ_08590 [Planctomycetia bacterium]